MSTLPPPLLTSTHARDLAAVFERHHYTVDAVVEAIGDSAHRALGRNSTVPAERALADRDDLLATLTRLWLLQQPMATSLVERALPGLVEPLIEAHILTQQGALTSAAIDVRPYASDDGASGWIVADLTPSLDTTSAPIRTDFVLGVSSASSTLAQLTVRESVGRALDLGTGCGVQSLHLARHCDEVVATDLNPRALQLAQLTAMINDVTIDLRLGDLYSPVAQESFDLITSNPPYVMSPPRHDRDTLTYREGNLAADGLVTRVITEGAARLNPGGKLQVLANWAHVRGEDWDARLAGWIDPTGCDAHVVQREVLEPAEYVELWLTDAGLAGTPDYRQRYLGWLAYFDSLGIEGVGMGWVTLHQAQRAVPQVSIEHWPHPIEQPIGPAIAARISAVSTLITQTDEQLLAARLILAEDVIEQSEGMPGATDPQHVVLRSQRGFRRAVEVDTATAGVLGACDGELSLKVLIDSVAELLEVDSVDLTADLVPRVRMFIRDGYLRPTSILAVE